MEKVIKVLVVDDSAFNRKTLTSMLESSHVIRVIGTAVDGEDAFKKLLTLKPDIVTLDLEMPRMDGFTFLRLMMSKMPVPTIVVSSRNEDKNVFKALEFGAVDFIAKPTHHISTKLAKIQEELIEKVGMAGQVSMDIVKSRHVALPDVPAKKEKEVQIEAGDECHMVVVGASTGGPPALQALLTSIKPDMHASIAISQHMPVGFTRTFSERLNRLSPLHVKEAEDGETVRAGHVLISPGGYHMTFRRMNDTVIVRLVEGHDTDRYVPSVDRMFVSASDVFGAKTLGVVMTGMGNDGREGVLKIKERGGRVIAQSEETSVIFGMPREAIATGKVDSILPLDRIAEGISSLCKPAK